ncbi:germ cell-specific gene 1-like protein [Carettochelys insculpta]|uniref:germ cell-specific gene 1-like protein n=1 Tax=Carettochelys insculpta TaxID=44489 RepID=UPI003EC04210
MKSVSISRAGAPAGSGSRSRAGDPPRRPRSQRGRSPGPGARTSDSQPLGGRPGGDANPPTDRRGPAARRRQRSHRAGLLRPAGPEMLRLSRRTRSLLALGLTALALGLAVSAFATSYWCEGTHRVVKPPCLSASRRGSCAPGAANGSEAANATLEPNAVQYVWETGEDKYVFRSFHTGFWLSCEEHRGDELCRSFIELPPESEKGVLWLSVASEFLFIGLLSISFLLMALDATCYAGAIGGLKINAFAAVITVLSGLLGMVAHMMYMTVFQVAVSLGPKDWRPQTWYYGWSFGMAWLSFTLCMSAAVLTLNTYTKTLLELQYRQRAYEQQSLRVPSPAPHLERLLWDKYIFSISDALPFPPGHACPAAGGHKGCRAGCAGLAGGRCGAGDPDDGEPC